MAENTPCRNPIAIRQAFQEVTYSNNVLSDVRVLTSSKLVEWARSQNDIALAQNLIRQVRPTDESFVFNVRDCDVVAVALTTALETHDEQTLHKAYDLLVEERLNQMNDHLRHNFRHIFRNSTENT